MVEEECRQVSCTADYRLTVSLPPQCVHTRGDPAGRV